MAEYIGKNGAVSMTVHGKENALHVIHRTPVHKGEQQARDKQDVGPLFHIHHYVKKSHQRSRYAYYSLTNV